MHQWETFDRGLTKRIKLEFPRFSGKNLSAWVYRANQYFLYHQIPPGQGISHFIWMRKHLFVSKVQAKQEFFDLGRSLFK